MTKKKRWWQKEYPTIKLLVDIFTIFGIIGAIFYSLHAYNQTYQLFERTNRPFLYIDPIASPINSSSGIKFEFNNAGNLPAAFNISYKNLSAELCGNIEMIGNKSLKYPDYVFPNNNKAYFNAEFRDSDVKECGNLKFQINITYWPINLEEKRYYINYTILYKKEAENNNFGLFQRTIDAN